MQCNARWSHLALQLQMVLHHGVVARIMIGTWHLKHLQETSTVHHKFHMEQTMVRPNQLTFYCWAIMQAYPDSYSDGSQSNVGREVFRKQVYILDCRFVGYNTM